MACPSVLCLHFIASGHQFPGASSMLAPSLGRQKQLIPCPLYLAPGPLSIVMVKVTVAESCPTLCDPTDGSPPGSSVHGTLQARTLEWVAISFSKRNYRKKESEVTQSCLTLCDPMDCSLPGFSIHGIFQTRVLEWVAISFSMNIIKKAKLK